MLALTIWTWVLAVLLLAKGIVVCTQGEKLYKPTKAALYNRPLGIVMWVLAIAWTLWEVTKLGPADFGSFKTPLFVLFSAIGVGAIWMIKDYLIVRAIGVLWLYVAWWILQAAYLQEPWQRLIVVSLVYLGIVKALWLTVAPWRARQFVEWVYGQKWRWKTLAGLYVALGIVLAGVALSY